MNEPRVSTAGLVLCTAICSALSVAAAREQDAAAQRTVWDRVFTEAQASRGEELYGRHCAECHGSGLDGDAASEIPALVGDSFMQRWSGRNIDDLLTRMQRAMPPAAPGSLARSQYADLAAYLLKSNGFPSGFDALGIDADRLRLIAIRRTQPSP